MTELAAVATVLRCIGEVAQTGALGRRLADIRVSEAGAPGEGLHGPETRTEIFTGMQGTGGAGAAAYLTARRADHRMVV